MTLAYLVEARCLFQVLVVQWWIIVCLKAKMRFIEP